MNFPGDCRGSIVVGSRFGPDAHGLMHEVTTVRYDDATKMTRVTTRKLETDGQRLRFVGGDQ